MHNLSIQLFWRGRETKFDFIFLSPEYESSA